MQLRVLSYNMNMLPWGAGGAFQEERARTFLSYVEQEKYDVLCLQELFAAALLPNVAQKVLCFQRKLIDALYNMGYQYSVYSRQPSYVSVLRYGMVTDTGLLILSKVPVVDSGSFTVRSTTRGQHKALRGCIFAKLSFVDHQTNRVADMAVFNMYLRPGAPEGNTGLLPDVVGGATQSHPRDQDGDQQVNQLCRFIESTLEPRGGRQCAFLLCGNFYGDFPGNQQHFEDFVARLQHSSVVGGQVVDVLHRAYGRNVPTRPPRLFFQTRAELCLVDAEPQRQDFLLIGNVRSEGIHIQQSHLEKFHAPPLRPYVYLSDHFGVCTELSFAGKVLKGPANMHHEKVKASGGGGNNNTVLIDGTRKVLRSYTLWTMEVAVMLTILMLCVFYVPKAEIAVPCIALLLSLRWLFGHTVIREGLAVATSMALVASGATRVHTEDIHNTSQNADRDVNPNRDGIVQPTAIWELWEKSVEKNRWQRCLGQRSVDSGIMFDSEWLTFAQVDARVRDFGSGLLLSCVKRGDTIGMLCGSNRRAVVADLACLGFGIATLTLAGTQPVIRQLLDTRGIRVVVASRTSVMTLLESRSRCLRTIITLHPTEYEEEALAKDLNVELLRFETVEGLGKANPCTPCPIVAEEAPFTQVVESSATGVIEVNDFTQHDLIRAIASLQERNVVPRQTAATPQGTAASDTTRGGVVEVRRDMMVWFAPFSTLFHRILVLSMLLCGGNSVACAEHGRLHDALRYFRPTVLVAPPSLFYSGEQQFRDAMRKWTRAFRFLFMSIYRFRSQLIHEHHRDSSTLRKIFFHSFQRHIGGNVKKIVISGTDTSTPFSVHEFIAVCYHPCVREVLFHQKIGVVAVDGTPSSHCTVAVVHHPTTPLAADDARTLVPITDVSPQPMEDDQGQERIGRLQVTLKSLHHPHTQRAAMEFDVAAVWTTSEQKSLKLLGPAEGILWPVPYLHVSAQDMERTYSQCRYVFDIFVTCESGRPLVAVVHPNKDLIEWEWLNRFKHMSTKQLSWPELVSFATPLVMEAFGQLAKIHDLHLSQRITAVHMHPHTFSEHGDFFTPHGRLRRARLTDYFRRHVQRLYGGSQLDRSLLLSPVVKDIDEIPNALSSSALDIPRPLRRHPLWQLVVPVAVDIGGTFAKIVYLRPPGGVGLPSFVQREYNALEKAMMPDLRFFRETSSPSSSLAPDSSPNADFPGELCFARLESKRVPDFVEFLQQSNATSLYKQEHVEQVRATGGGAFKYAALVQSQLGVKLRVVKEMDSIVWGLHLLLRVAPETIFTVDADSGTPQPHKIVAAATSHVSETTSSPSPQTTPIKDNSKSHQQPRLDPFPFLIVNIGSGISIVKCVNGDGTYERVGGSAIGGATFWGLVRTMTNINSWDEVLETTRVDGPGDNTNVDLLVGDIYGYNATDLPSMLSVDTVASTFGKLGTDRFSRTNSHHTRRPSTMSEEDLALSGSPSELLHESMYGVPADDGDAVSARPPATVPLGLGGVGPNARNGAPSSGGIGHHHPNLASIDVVRSLLIMIANNVTQLAYLHCCTEHTKYVFFTGGFVRDNPIVWRQISKSMRYWSKGALHAHFIAHDGYLGALGTATIDL
ncbi:pantothenate kinase subunit, putative [Bodo saltans]|uniref:Pantothenate kinase subunit, putative n=1 Tax=Bodo saltans TaxID=75058 RepID=A0A0S4IR34_BODSA|nr:pantothenate kinase subunit, putative [Bodo saltans]|eukprot:CUG00007.1 pantothenate kinase subunit, putative [Bodo saltans]